VILIELLFKPGKKGKGVGGAPGKTRHDFLIEEAADLSGFLLDDILAHGYLAIASHGQPSASPDTENSRTARSWMIPHACPNWSL
jgi:hypothetical protein